MQFYEKEKIKKIFSHTCNEAKVVIINKMQINFFYSFQFHIIYYALIIHNTLVFPHIKKRKKIDNSER